MSRRILIVDDELERLGDFSQTLARLCPDWELAFMNSGVEALKYLEVHPCDVVLTDLDMPDMNGAQLLNEIGRKYPAMVRFILSGTVDRDMVMRVVLGAHHFLPHPCPPEVVRDEVTRALALDGWVGNEGLRNLVARIRTFPSIPSLYFEVLRELRSADASAERVGEIIAKDLAMSTKVLQVLNSAFYAIPRQITDPTEAVNLLGFEMVKSLVLCIQVFSQFDKVKPYYFSIDKLWRHSTLVAHAARKIVRYEDWGADAAEEAYTGGLLHDIGKLVLVSNFAEQYQEAEQRAREQARPMWDAELEVFGATHAQIGAYLIGTWGMPMTLAEAAAYHHSPAQHVAPDARELVAVHAANALVHEAHSEEDPGAVPTLDEDYLARLGFADHIPQWRDLVAGRDVPRRAAPPAAAAKPVKSRAAPRRWLWADWRLPSPKQVLPAALGIATLVASAVVWRHWPAGSVRESLPPAPADPTNGAMSSATAESPAMGAPEAHTDEPLTNGVAAVDITAPSRVDPEGVTSTPTNPPAATQKPPATGGFPELKLQGIYFVSTNSSALINNHTVRPGDEIEGVRVLSIGPRAVIVEFMGEKRALSVN